MNRTVVRLDRALGRNVLAGNNRTVGRLEEFRATRDGRDWVVTEYVIGNLAWFERLLLGARLLVGLGRKQVHVARWDQLDLSTPERPRLLCSFDELRVEKP